MFACLGVDWEDGDMFAALFLIVSVSILDYLGYLHPVSDSL